MSAVAESPDVLLRVEHLTKVYPIHGAHRVGHPVVADISFTVRRGETIGVIGESGSGKSTVARCIMRIVEPTSGSVWFDGTDLTGLSDRAMRAARRKLQMVFQNPFASLDARRSIGYSIAEPLVAHRIGTRRSRQVRVEQLLECVGLSTGAASCHPSEFSGGERQRIAIARALALEPLLVICDEPISSLDVSIQAQILNLLRDLQDEFGYTYVFITHDIGVVRAMSDTLVVMKDGEIVESGATATVCESPRHPYTRRLIEASEPVTT